MRFKKIKHVPMAANSNRSLILRQRWSMLFLRQPHDKVFINLDQSWCGLADMRRTKWCPPASTNSVPFFSITPRVTLLLGVNSLGSVYLSVA